MSDIGTFLGKISGRILNAANNDKKLRCYQCQTITEHASIGYGDLAEMEGNGDMNSTASGFSDFTPGAPLLLGNVYCCTVCQSIRSHGGALSSIANRARHGENM